MLLNYITISIITITSISISDNIVNNSMHHWYCDNDSSRISLTGALSRGESKEKRNTKKAGLVFSWSGSAYVVYAC